MMTNKVAEESTDAGGGVTGGMQRAGVPDPPGCCQPSGWPMTRRARAVAGLAGVCGSVSCVASMVLPLVGLAGAGVATGAQASGGLMPGMGPAPLSQPGGVLGFVVTIGPELLVVSVLLVTVSLALRRRAAAGPALAAGALLYWGMYGQTLGSVMYATIAMGYLIWAGTYAWTRVQRPLSSLAGPSAR